MPRSVDTSAHCAQQHSMPDIEKLLNVSIVYSTRQATDRNQHSPELRSTISDIKLQLLPTTTSRFPTKIVSGAVVVGPACRLRCPGAGGRRLGRHEPAGLLSHRPDACRGAGGCGCEAVSIAASLFDYDACAGSYVAAVHAYRAGAVGQGWC